MALVFEWNPAKARANLTKHGVSFLEAASVFADPLALIFPDNVHSRAESRELIIGHSSRRNLLVVSFAEPAASVRIISARPATRRERRNYEENVTS
jgi:uncharacterized DUF497 family protein